MMKLSYEQILATLEQKAGLPKDEIEQRVKNKLTQLSGLISREGAAHIVANEMGIGFTGNNLGGKLKVSEVLPGMEQVRSRKLDNLCEAIAECRAQKNAAVTEEKSLDATALQVMVGEGLAVYRHGGVELARIPGAEKLRVRMTREEGDAGDADLKEPPELDIEPEG